jgi:hypothetical protein
MFSLGSLLCYSAHSNAQAHPELYLLKTNPSDWEAMYLHPQYHTYQSVGEVSDCHDVFKVSISSKFSFHH